MLRRRCGPYLNLISDVQSFACSVHGGDGKGDKIGEMRMKNGSNQVSVEAGRQRANGNSRQATEKASCLAQLKMGRRPVCVSAFRLAGYWYPHFASMGQSVSGR